MTWRDETCDFCERPATVSDGICQALLCDSTECLDRAWDRAFPKEADR